MRRPSKVKLLVSAIAIASFGTANIAMAQQDTTQAHDQHSVSQAEERDDLDETSVSQTEDTAAADERESGIAQTDDPQSDRAESEDDQQQAGQAQDDMAYDELKTEYAMLLGDDADTVIASLRNGENIEFEKDGETVTIENNTDSVSAADLSLALALAEKELDEDADLEELADFLLEENTIGNDGVLVMRQEGDDWGEIYDEYGHEVAEVMAEDQPATDAQVSVDTDPAPALRTETEDTDDADSRREIADRGNPDN